MFEGLAQPMHLILILVIVLIVFGPGKLPELGEGLGKSIREFRISRRWIVKKKRRLDLVLTKREYGLERHS
jgi:TatA/E family protein of Tat protein translocase